MKTILLRLFSLGICAFAEAMTAHAQVPYELDHFGPSYGSRDNLTGASGAHMFVKLSPKRAPTVRSGEISLEDRVAYQRGVEEVYWRHRVWPKERPDLGPSLDAVLPPGQIKQKVLDYLRNSQALMDYWRQPVRPEQLQAEMNRMAQHTQQPEVLRELFEALGNDPFVIAECLARPALAERMLTNLYAYDPRLHGELKQRAETDLRVHHTLHEMKQTSGTYAEIELIGSDKEESRNVGSGVKMSSREWDQNVQRVARIFRVGEKESAQFHPTQGGGRVREPQIVTGVLSALQEDDNRYYAIAVVEKTKNHLKLAIVEWRKEPLESWRARMENQLPSAVATANENYTLPAISGSGDGCPDNWVTSTSFNIPTGRESHSVVWTGSEMIIWGGYGGDLAGFNSGGRYSPSTGTWTNTSTVNTPSKRIGPQAVWTGSEMIVWGGTDIFGPSNAGGKYNPSSDSWTAMTNTNAPTGRGGQTAVWTGSEMIVWGGGDGHVYLNTGGRYNPTADIWTSTSTTDAPTGRVYHTAVWTGNEMIIWGGNDVNSNAVDTGGKYNPFTNGWTPTRTDGAPRPRNGHNAVWTGSEMIIWGGWDQRSITTYLNTGSRYDPYADTWTAINNDNAPSARNAHSAVWSGNEMIVWGGRGELGYANTGGRYNLATNSWSPTSISNASPGRWLHTAVWTGTEMIVWGGEGDGGSPTGFLSTGARYNPTTDGWAPIGNTPTGRNLHTVAWTGTEMIALAGFDGFGNTNTGGKYNLATDAWMATSTTNAPDPRRLHASVWTGVEMIVWGGFVEYMGAVNTGGRYNPDTNSWTAISTNNAPLARSFHTAVWSGSEMIVWGGYDSSGVPFNTGGRYNPVTNSWTATSTANAPTARLRHTAVWTGDEMVIWGGTPDGSNYLNTGGKYNFGTDTWTNISTSNAPSARFVHTAVWTGNEMIVWGGYNGSVHLKTGGRYNAGTNSWATTSPANAPSGRALHTSVWTGTEMIVWGGENSDWLNTGGRYSPGTDSWIATATTDSAPIGRAWSSAVWTGSKMIVWAGLGQFGYLNSGGIYCAQPAPPTPSPTPRPATMGNISTRLQVGTVNNVAIAGFIVQGSTGKRVLIRAAGPSLAQSGVPNPLANPRLELHQATNTIGVNDNWQTTQIGGVTTSDQVAEIQNSGLAPQDPFESALIATLAPGSYTAVVQGVNNGTGVGLVEVYDLEATSGSRLVNISTRGFVQTGDDVMIGGFIVVTQPTTVIIRAIGPSLTQFGVPDALANPQLELHDANNLIGRNDDWQTTEIGGIITSDQVAQIQNSQLAPGSAAESAIIATLQPGNYTAIVRGVNTTAGNALVEVYALQ